MQFQRDLRNITLGNNNRRLLYEASNPQTLVGLRNEILTAICYDESQAPSESKTKRLKNNVY